MQPTKPHLHLFVPTQLLEKNGAPKSKKKKKAPRQRALIILTDTDNGNFELDIRYEPSIKGKDTTKSMAVRVAREVSFQIVSKYSSPKIIITDEK